MSNLLNLDHMFMESSFSKLLKNPIVSESYRSSVLVPLRIFNEAFNDNTEKLYMSISEAESKEKENEIFTHYFIEIEKAFSELIKQISEIESRFIIRIDNMVDANLDMLKNTSALADCKPFQYRMYKFKNIADADFPKMNPLSLYNKEFDFLGQLLQDLGPAATNQMKLQVIASVYNMLNKGNSDQLTKKCVKDILDSDDDDDCDISKFPKKLYEKFKEDDAEDKIIDKGMLYSIQLSLKNYKSTVSAATSASEKLISQFEEIKRSLMSFIDGNAKKTLEINTPTDGVKNTTYKVDTYAMNQLDLFMKTKINQIVQMANIYVIALSVKLDAVAEYYKQCKDIIVMADMNSVGIPGTSEDNKVDTDTNMGDEYPEEDDGPTGEEDSDEPEDDDDDGESDGGSDHNTDPEEDPVNDDSTLEKEPESDDDDSDMNDLSSDLDEAMKDFEEACILADYQIFAIEQENARSEMYNRVLSYYQEDGEQTTSTTSTSSTTTSSSSGTSIPNAKKAVDQSGKESIINSIIRKLEELWRNFQEKVFVQSTRRLEVLKKNEKYINTKPFDVSGDNIMVSVKEDLIDRIEIPDFNYNQIKEKLSNEDEFFKKTWPSIQKADDQKISDAVINHVLDYDNPVTNTNQLQPIALYNWCKLYPTLKATLEKDMATIKKGQNNAKNIAKQAVNSEAAESFEGIMKSYFTELNIPKEPEKDKGDNTPSDNAPANVTVYFKVCNQVCRAKMTVIQRVFNEYTAYLLWHINKRRENEGSPKISWINPKTNK